MAESETERAIRRHSNVYADLNLPNAAELDTKARLCAALLHYKLEGYSVERLIRFLVALGQDVEILVKAKPSSRTARIAVKVA